MDIQKAIDIILEQNELNEAKSVLESEKEKTRECLLKRIEEILDANSINENIERIPQLLRLSAVYNVKAFKVYYKLIEDNILPIDANGNSIIQSQLFIEAFGCSISNLDELEQIKILFFAEDIDDIRRITILNIIKFYCSSTLGFEKLENTEFSEALSQRNNILKEFYYKVINWIFEFYNLSEVTDNEFSRTNRHYNMYCMLQPIIQSCFSEEDCVDLKIKNNLFSVIVKIIITSEIDYNNSLFRNYIKLFKTIFPQKYCDTIEVANYIRNIRKTLYKENIFNASSIKSVGQVLYQKIIDDNECSEDLVKLAIQINRRFPFNKRPKPVTTEAYFDEIAAYLDIQYVPSIVLEKANEQYDLVRKELTDLFKRIDTLEEKCDSLVKKSEENSERIRKQNKKNILAYDTTIDRKKLLIELQNRKELESLYIKKKETTSEEDTVADSYLKYCKICLQDTFALFIDGTKTPDEKEETLKQWVIIDICSRESDSSKDDSIYKIKSRFTPYFNIIKQINIILEGDPLKIIMRIRYRIKSLVFLDEITDKHKMLSGVKLTDQSSIEYKNYINEIENHPLYVDTLLNIDKPSEYLERQKRVVNNAIDRIIKNIEQSLCLKKRKRVIDQIIMLFKNKEYEIIINIIPIQIEGIFADFLENSLIYKSESDLGSYEQIYKYVLRRKMKMVETKRLNLGFETIGYFRYYFNSVYRNTVAHGNYWLLGYIHFKSDGISDEQAMAIIAHDLIFDLNYIIDAVSMSNEIDEAKRYLEYTADALCKVNSCGEMDETDKSEPTQSFDQENELLEISKMDTRYERFYLDLLGESRFNAGKYLKGFFIAHEPVQLLFWIFNPIIERAVGAGVCNKIRQVILSQEFWEYVVAKLQRGLILNDCRTLDEVINLLMPILKKDDKDNSVFKLAVKAKKIIKQISARQ